MVRSDGKAIPLENVWTSKTRLVDNNTVGWEYWFNVFDANSTGSYALLMGAPDLGPVAPEFTPLNNISNGLGICREPSIYASRNNYR